MVLNCALNDLREVQSHEEMQKRIMENRGKLFVGHIHNLKRWLTAVQPSHVRSDINNCFT